MTSAHGSHHKVNEIHQVNTWVLNQPLSFQSPQANGIVDARSDSSVISQTEAVVDLYRYHNERGGDIGTDNEIVDAIGISFNITYVQLSFFPSNLCQSRPFLLWGG